MEFSASKRGMPLVRGPHTPPRLANRESMLSRLARPGLRLEGICPWMARETRVSCVPVLNQLRRPAVRPAVPQSPFPQLRSGCDAETHRGRSQPKDTEVGSNTAKASQDVTRGQSQTRAPRVCDTRTRKACVTGKPDSCGPTRRLTAAPSAWYGSPQRSAEGWHTCFRGFWFC